MLYIVKKIIELEILRETPYVKISFEVKINL